MKLIHSMRLKGPWDYVWLTAPSGDKPDALPRKGTVKIPVTWDECFGKTLGSVQWNRRFQKPTNLDPTERAMIAAPTLAGVTAVRVNETDLPMGEMPESGFRFDVTEMLEPSNVLQIEMNCDSEDQISERGMTEPAVIEIWSLTG